MPLRIPLALALGAGLAGLALSAADAQPEKKPKPEKPVLEKRAFGKTPDGTSVDLYVLTNTNGVQAKVITYGGIVTELHVPDRDGKFADVVLGFDDLKGYLGGHPYFGAIVGRYANRIAGAQFTLDGKTYKLAANNGKNSLHGGKKGFDKVVWKAEPANVDDGVGVLLRYTSPDGEEGYPGTLKTAVRYTLTNDNALRIDYEAATDKATPVNLSNHSYFNLGGHASGDVLGHVLMIAADKYTPVDANLIPTGEIKPVAGTPLDFRKPKPIGRDIGELKGDPGGYDHNFVLNGGDKKPFLAARAFEPKSGRLMEMFTTEPGVQFYTGNFLNGQEKGKGGTVYRKHAGFCLEAQHFPDSVHHANFPSVTLKPGETYKQTTIYRFSTAK